MKRPVLLLVTASPQLRDLRAKVLATGGFAVHVSESFQQAEHLISSHKLDALLLGNDISCPSGEQLAVAFRRRNPGTCVIMLGAHGPAAHCADYILPSPSPQEVFELLRRCTTAGENE